MQLIKLSLKMYGSSSLEIEIDFCLFAVILTI